MPAFRFSSFGDKFQAAWMPPATVNLGAKKLCFRGCFYNIYFGYFVSIIFYYIYFSIIFTTNSKPIAHNVPAVYDVFAARIRALRSKDQGCKMGGGVSRGRGA
jgi:hypothetical protein